jgi:hypothetical protein
MSGGHGPAAATIERGRKKEEARRKMWRMSRIVAGPGTWSASVDLILNGLISCIARLFYMMWSSISKPTDTD